jgi:hypothetical protein
VEKFRSLSPVLLATASDKVSQVPLPGASAAEGRTPGSCGLEESRPAAIPPSTPRGVDGPPERAAAAAGPPHGSVPLGSSPGWLKAASSPAFHPGDGSPTGSALGRSPPSSLACPAVSCEPLLGPAFEAGSVRKDAVQGGRPSPASPAASSLGEDRDPPPLATPPTSSPRTRGLLHLLLPCLARH